MNLYHLEFKGIDLLNHHDYVMARNIDEAYRKAQKLLESYQKDVAEDAELICVEFENEITYVEGEKA